MSSSDESGDVSQLSRALLAIKQLRARLAAVEEAKAEPIAIIGIGCRFPGGVQDPDGFWDLMRDGVDTVTKVPASRWSLDDDGPDRSASTGADFGAFLSDVDQFDPNFFGISPREARGMDPQQRLLMETAVEALERSGQVMAELAGSRTGVFIGAHSHSTDYGFLQNRSYSTINAYSITGTGLSILANRLSYLFDLKGPSLTVDAACSSSLVSTHLAVRSLRSGESDVALAGGVNMLLAPEIAHAVSQLQALSSDGRCKTFDAAADGFVRGEGCGVVVLKRLSDAERNGDPVLALIRGSAVYQDGATNGLTAPNGLMQQQVIRDALTDGRVEADSITLVEAHGTGTILGDPIEVEALSEVLGHAGNRTCVLGSVKTNIGHLEGAAGIAGLIKVVLALRHQTIPPHLHFQTLNPHITLDGTRFEIADARRPWLVDDGPRRAGVSSFGIGGTNAHLVLEEAPTDDAKASPVEDRERDALLPLSARTPSALREHARQVAEFAAGTAESPADICDTAARRRDHHDHRLIVSGTDMQSIGEALSAFGMGEDHDDVVVGAVDDELTGDPVFVFSGQGPELVPIARELLDEPAFGEVIASCDEALRKHADWSLLDELTTEATSTDQQRNDIVHVSIFAIQAGLAALWKSWGVNPAAVIGHSVGEIAAAHAAGALTLDAGVEIALRRGRILNRASGLGTMVNVGLPDSEVRPLLTERPGLSIAVVNGPDSTVVSGDREQLQDLVDGLAADDVFARFLTGVDYPSHSVLMEPFGAELAEVLNGIEHDPPTVPLYTTSCQRWANANDFDADFWGANLRSPVMFAAGVQAMVADGHRSFVEISHHPMLGSSIAGVAGAEALVVESLRRGQPQRRQCLKNLAALFVRGVEVDWSAVHPAGRFVELPTYPWQRQRYWLEASDLPRPEGRRTGNPLLGVRTNAPLPTFAQIVGVETMPFLDDHRVAGRMILPTAAIVAMAQAGAEQAWGESNWSVSELGIDQALTIEEEVNRSTQLVLTTAGPDRRFQLFSQDETGTWTQHAQGFLTSGHTLNPTTVDLEAVQARSTGGSVESHYATLAEGGLRFGPAFRGIRELWQGDGEALASIAVPADVQPSSVPVVALDACLQTLATTIPGNDLHLLVAVERITEPEWADVAWSHASVRREATSGDQTVIGDVRFCDASGTVIGLASGVLLKRADAAAVERLSGRASHLDDWLYEVAWEARATDPASPDPVSDSGWLVFADNGSVGQNLVERFRSQGQRVVSVRKADRFEQQGDSITLDPTEPTQFALLAESDDNLPTRAVYLWGLDLQGTADPSSATAGALHLSQLLSSRPSSRVWFVTSHAQSVAGEGTNPSQAALWGLGRVVALELPDLWGGLIDLDGDQDTKVLTAELASDDSEDQVAYRNQMRHVARLSAVTVPRTEPTDRFGNGATLITGGLGGLGLQLARWLTDQGARNLILTGRIPLPDRSTWDDLAGKDAAGVDTENDAEVRRRVAAVQDLERRGAVVDVRSVDVGDEEQMSTLLSELGRQQQPLRHMFHLAMAADYAPITDLTGEQLDRMFRAKVLGGRILHEQSLDLDLETFVLFSSTTALWGVSEMAHYAAANAYLDGLAWYRRAEGLPALSINWGIWSEIRDALELDREGIANFGLRPMTTELALDAMQCILDADVPQMAVADVDWKLLKGTYESRRVRDLLTNIGTADIGPSGPTTAATPAALVSELKAAEPHEHERLVLDHVSGLVSAVLGYAETEQEIDHQQGLFDVGLDSLMAVELRERLEVAVGTALPTTLIFNHPTVAAIADFLFDSALGESEADQDESVAERVEEAPATGDGDDPDQGQDLLARFDDEIGKIDDLLRG